MAEEWFRTPDWSADTREDFEQRLRRARGWSRPQYLRIKGLALADAGELEGARALWLRVLESTEELAERDKAAALEHLAESFSTEDPPLAAHYRRLYNENPFTQRQAKTQEKLEAKERQGRLEEAPLLRDLGAIGVDVPTVWHLYLYPDAYPQVIPVLLEHISKDYPRGTLEGIGNALGDTSARPWWDHLKHLCLNDEREVVRERLSVALSDIAVREHYADLLSLFQNADLGSNRIFFVRPINKIGNRMSPGEGRAAIARFASDPVVGMEVTAVLQGRGLAD